MHEHCSCTLLGRATWSRLPRSHSGQMLLTKPMNQDVVEMGVTPMPPPTPAGQQSVSDAHTPHDAPCSASPALNCTNSVVGRSVM